MKQLYTHIFILALVLTSCTFAPIFVYEWGPDETYNLPGSYNQLNTVLTDSSGRQWTLYASNAYGFWEFWMAWADKDGDWSRPVYSGIPSNPNYYYEWDIIEPNKFNIKRTWNGGRETFYQRMMYDPKVKDYTINKSDIYYDTDADGLTDYSEYVLLTDPLDNDTDGDGKADGFDSNPLAGPPDDSLSEHAKLHKYIIERQLYLFDTKRLVIVEQFENTPMEYKRRDGLVLSLSSDECDSYLDNFGYGTPIMTASIKDTLSYYLVNYQLYIDPDTAFGFDALYRWSDKYKQFVRKKTLYNWESVPRR